MTKDKKTHQDIDITDTNQWFSDPNFIKPCKFNQDHSKYINLKK